MSEHNCTNEKKWQNLTRKKQILKYIHVEGAAEKVPFLNSGKSLGGHVKVCSAPLLKTIKFHVACKRTQKRCTNVQNVWLISQAVSKKTAITLR